jgi:AraC-like DNA-binding protein
MRSKNIVHYKNCFGIELFEGHDVDHVFPWHFHPQYNIVLVEEGIMRYYFSDGEVDVRRNQFFVINPYQVHYNAAATASCAYKAIFLPSSFVASNESNLPSFKRGADSNVAVFNELQRYASSLKTVSAKEEVMAIGKNISHLLLYNLDVIGKEASTDERILPALQHINENTDKRILVKDLASICCLSLFHFQRVFRESVGLPVNAYVHQLKIERSKQLLYQGAKISTTAFDTGYFDQSHFHRVFKKMYIVPPAKFSK